MTEAQGELVIEALQSLHSAIWILAGMQFFWLGWKAITEYLGRSRLTARSGGL
jgi:threonine/homoserine/homoserine lactone efflux protein